MKVTAGIENLVNDALRALPKPHGQDITLHVAQWIKRNRLLRYNSEVNAHGQLLINRWLGRYVKMKTGMQNLSKVSAPLGEIIKTYTKFR
jgi:hypothetical protein